MTNEICVEDEVYRNPWLIYKESQVNKCSTGSPARCYQDRLRAFWHQFKLVKNLLLRDRRVMVPPGNTMEETRSKNEEGVRKSEVINWLQGIIIYWKPTRGMYQCYVDIKSRNTLSHFFLKYVALSFI